MSEEQVLEIQASTKSQYELGRVYGVAQTTISAIKRGATWSWLTRPEEHKRDELDEIQLFITEVK